MALVACDPIYLRDHGFALIGSISANSPHTTVHLHIIGSYPQVGALREFLADRARCAVEISTEDPPLQAWPDEARRTYYACSRFRIAADLMEKSPASYFILDADSLVRRPLRAPQADLGLVFRSKARSLWGRVPIHLRLAAGLVYVAPTPSGRQFLTDLKERLAGLSEPRHHRWYLDQIALWRAFSRSRARGAVFHAFGTSDIDWEFNDASMIWTAKGARKSSPVFLSEAEKYEITFSAC